MSKMYVKDSNGKYKLVDKDRDQKEETSRNNLVMPNKELSLEEIDARPKRLESIVIDPRK